MGRQHENAEEWSPEPMSPGARVYLPCPECRGAVLLADALVREMPQTYECPTCGTRFELRPDPPS